MSEADSPPRPSAAMTTNPSILHQVCIRFQFPPTAPITPHQLNILHSINQHIPTLNQMRRGFIAMSRVSHIATSATGAAIHPRLVWARTVSISLSNIQIALCSFCVFREDKTGGDVDLLVEILQPVSVRLDALRRCYYELQASGDPAVTQMYTYAVARTEAYLRIVMRVAGCWWEDAYLDSVGREKRGVKREWMAEDVGLVDGKVENERAVKDEIFVKEESVVSDNRTIAEGSVVSEGRIVTASISGAETRGGSVWSAAEETGSVTTASDEHAQRVSATGGSVGGRRSASTAPSAHKNKKARRDYSRDRDTISIPASSPEPDRDTDSFKSGGGETDRDTESWWSGSAEPVGPSPETEPEEPEAVMETEVEDDPWNDELFASTSSPVWCV